MLPHALWFLRNFFSLQLSSWFIVRLDTCLLRLDKIVHVAR